LKAAAIGLKNSLGAMWMSCTRNKILSHLCLGFKQSGKFSAILFGLCLAVALFAHNPARSQGSNLNVQGFIEKCTKNETIEHLFCLGYVAALVDALTIPDLRMGGEKSCMPISITYGAYFTYIQEFFRSIESNKRLSDAGAASIIVFALRRKYPCN
jgi:hypothetical protein